MKSSEIFSNTVYEGKTGVRRRVLEFSPDLRKGYPFSQTKLLYREDGNAQIYRIGLPAFARWAKREVTSDKAE